MSLVDSNPATAKKMLERLIALLRGAAAAAGTTEATLAAQVEHLRAYLELMALRMGGRLTFRIDVPPALAGLALPPLLLQPLVENAIKHGLEPKVEGGEVVVSARARRIRRARGGRYGRGFRDLRVRSAEEGGVGLANLRARLAALYGDTASIDIEEDSPVAPA